MAKSNYDRLVAAGIIKTTGLSADAIDQLNSIDLTDQEVKMLSKFQNDLGLDPLALKVKDGKIISTGGL
jgi:hypothetical protein